MNETEPAAEALASFRTRMVMKYGAEYVRWGHSVLTLDEFAELCRLEREMKRAIQKMNFTQTDPSQS